MQSHSAPLALKCLYYITYKLNLKLDLTMKLVVQLSDVYLVNKNDVFTLKTSQDNLKQGFGINFFFKHRIHRLEGILDMLLKLTHFIVKDKNRSMDNPQKY